MILNFFMPEHSDLLILQRFQQNVLQLPSNFFFFFGSFISEVSQFQHLMSSVWTENFPNYHSLVPFCLTVLPSTYLSPLAFCSKWQEIGHIFNTYLKTSLPRYPSSSLITERQDSSKLCHYATKVSILLFSRDIFLTCYQAPNNSISNVHISTTSLFKETQDFFILLLNILLASIYALLQSYFYLFNYFL